MFSQNNIKVGNTLNFLFLLIGYFIILFRTIFQQLIIIVIAHGKFDKTFITDKYL